MAKKVSASIQPAPASIQPAPASIQPELAPIEPEPAPAQMPCVFINGQQKTCGKTTYTTFLVDVLTLNGVKTRVQQADAQQRLSQMLGSVVENLRPNPNAVAEDSTLLSRSLLPFYEAAKQVAADRSALVLDGGANQVEAIAAMLTDVGFDEDMEKAGVKTFLSVPIWPRDPESLDQATFTIRQLRAAVPHSRLLLIENRFGGAIERIVPGSLAEEAYKRLLEVAKDAEFIVMPAIPAEYWAPCEGAGLRFLKVLALDPEEGPKTLGRSAGEVKLIKSAVARFWRAMHRQMSCIIDLPVGGE